MELTATSNESPEDVEEIVGIPTLEYMQDNADKLAGLVALPMVIYGGPEVIDTVPDAPVRADQQRALCAMYQNLGNSVETSRFPLWHPDDFTRSSKYTSDVVGFLVPHTKEGKVFLRLMVAPECASSHPLTDKHLTRLVGLSGVDAFTRVSNLTGKAFSEGDLVFTLASYTSPPLASSYTHLRCVPLQRNSTLRNALRNQYPAIKTELVDTKPFRNMNELDTSNFCWILDPPRQSNFSDRVVMPAIFPLVRGHTICVYGDVELPQDPTMENLQIAFSAQGCQDAGMLLDDPFFQTWQTCVGTYPEAFTATTMETHNAYDSPYVETYQAAVKSGRRVLADNLDIVSGSPPLADLHASNPRAFADEIFPPPALATQLANYAAIFIDMLPWIPPIPMQTIPTTIHSVVPESTVVRTVIPHINVLHNPEAANPARDNFGTVGGTANSGRLFDRVIQATHRPPASGPTPWKFMTLIDHEHRVRKPEEEVAFTRMDPTPNINCRTNSAGAMFGSSVARPSSAFIVGSIGPEFAQAISNGDAKNAALQGLARFEEARSNPGNLIYVHLQHFDQAGSTYYNKAVFENKINGVLCTRQLSNIPHTGYSPIELLRLNPTCIIHPDGYPQLPSDGFTFYSDCLSYVKSNQILVYNTLEYQTAGQSVWLKGILYLTALLDDGPFQVSWRNTSFNKAVFSLEILRACHDLFACIASLAMALSENDCSVFEYTTDQNVLAKANLAPSGKQSHLNPINLDASLRQWATATASMIASHCSTQTVTSLGQGPPAVTKHYLLADPPIRIPYILPVHVPLPPVMPARRPSLMPPPAHQPSQAIHPSPAMKPPPQKRVRLATKKKPTIAPFNQQLLVPATSTTSIQQILDAKLPQPKGHLYTGKTVAANLCIRYLLGLECSGVPVLGEQNCGYHLHASADLPGEPDQYQPLCQWVASNAALLRFSDAAKKYPTYFQ